MNLSNYQIELMVSLLKAVGVPLVLFGVVPLMVWVERRGSAFIQDRRGPSRAPILGYTLLGLPHLIADALKFFTKESFMPRNAHRLFYTLAPTMVLVPAVVAFAVIPFADDIHIGTRETALAHTLHQDGRLEITSGLRIPLSIARVEGGLLFAFAVGSLGVLGIILAGWSSGSKYPLLGAVRTASQMLSYELVLGLSALGVLLLYRTLEPNDIAVAQGQRSLGVPLWGFVLQPLACVMFVVAGFAECNRNPFDLPEGESEIVAGYHTEYSGMKFSMFMMAEYIAMITMSSLVVTLFFGGWQIPWATTDWFRVQLLGLTGDLQSAILVTALLQLGCFAAKVGFFLWLFVWVRWTLPRFRYDQLLDLGWKGLLPLGLANIAATTLVMGLMGWTLVLPLGILSLAITILLVLPLAWLDPSR